MAICGEHVPYYGDSITVSKEQTLDKTYIKLHLTKVEFKDIAKFAEHDGCGWRVKW